MDKQKEILAAALKLFVEFGFHGTPTSRIAKEAGVANGTLFHYFKTKDELVVALYNGIKNDLNGFLYARISDSDSIEERFKSLFINSIKWALKNNEGFYFVQQFHFSPHLSLVSPEEIEKQTSGHIRLLQEAIQAGAIKSMPTDLIYTMISSQIYGIHQYLATAALPTDEEDKIIGESFEMIYKMLKVDLRAR